MGDTTVTVKAGSSGATVKQDHLPDVSIGSGESKDFELQHHANTFVIEQGPKGGDKTTAADTVKDKQQGSDE